MLVKKPTTFMTNSPCIANRLSTKCQGGHKHITLLGGRAKRAEIYPDQLCREILIGLLEQMRADGRISSGGIGSISKYDNESSEEFNQELQKYWDDVTGKKLDSKMVTAARKEKLQ